MNSSRFSLAAIGLLVILLGILATLQYRWIAQLSLAEQARLQEGLDQAATNFCKDFDKEVARAFAIFSSDPADDGELPDLLTKRLGKWRSTSIWPALVKDLFIVRHLEGNDVELLHFDEQSQTLVQSRWSDDLQPIRRTLSELGPGVPTIDGVLPGLVLAINQRWRQENGTPIQWRPPRDHLVVRFDLSVVVETIFPQLAETHFGLNDGHTYLLSVSSHDRPRFPFFQRGNQASSREGQPDASARLLGLHSIDGPSLPPQGGFSPGRPPPPAHGRESRATNERRGPVPPRMRTHSEEGRWILAARHPKGSLEHVVAGARKRNMAISLVILVMLGITAVLLLVSTRKARRLARQQMDFVAAVSHELRTPLTAIRSAGQNLADGIIDDPERVQSYGLLIEREGRRLTEMIGRVLTFAGIRSGRQIYRMQPVTVAKIVEASLKDCSWVLEEKGFEISTEIADDLPPVQGDAAALQQVVTNLVDNAMKYAAGGAWLGIEASYRLTPQQGEVQITITDRGSGIPKAELSKIFEPFQRGTEAAGSNTPGSGLGLSVVRSIVQAHAGSIDVDSPPNGGTRFTIRLPATTGGAIAGGTP